VPVIVGHMSHQEESVRLASTRSLGEFGTPTAITALEVALDDAERSVRQLALSLLLERGGSGGLVRRLEELLFDGTERDWERSERRAFFEAYGSLAGEPAVARLRVLLEPRGLFRRREPPDTRACALFALAKIRTLDSRLLIDRFSADKEPVVRSAANTVLRDWAP